MSLFSKPSAPPAPDYTGAAQASGESAERVNTNQTYANRPTQITPWGRVDWTPQKTRDPSTGEKTTKWTQRQTLTPQSQRALNSELGQQQYRSELAQSLMRRIGDSHSEAPSFDEFGTIGDMRQGAEDAAYGRQTSRLDPQFEERREAQEVALRGQGLRPGTQAYDRAMAGLGRDETDAYAQARAQATAEGRAETGLSATLRQQEISEYLQERGVPINEVNAIMSGQQVQSPQMPGFQSSSRAAPVDYLGAAGSEYQGSLDRFNIDSANRQGAMSGLFSLGSAAMGMP